MKKIISFSLWGNNPKYCVGAVRNAELREKIYPEWTTRFYVHKEVPLNFINELKAIDQTEVIIEDRADNWTAMFWRFEPISEAEVDIMISRDCDSRINLREMHAVNEFIQSDKKFHIMRDHPHHGFNVLGGMFGIKKGLIKDMKKLCNDFHKTDKYGTDYEFFNQVITHIPKHEILTHDPFFEKTKFPTERQELEFVGEVFDENEYNNKEHTNALKSYLER